jgi:hypothetical protein
MEGLERERWERRGVKGLFFVIDTRNIEILSAVALLNYKRICNTFADFFSKLGFFAHFSVYY